MALFNYDEKQIKHLLPVNFDDIAYQAFKQFDKDNNNVIDKSELKTIFQDVQKKLNIEEEVSDEDIDEAIAQLDKNNNNVLEFDEFRRLFIGLYIVEN
jgi:Ca2+-binding EF-hand superfamily protein